MLTRFFLQLMNSYKEGFLNGVPKENGFDLIKESLSANAGQDRPAFLKIELADKPKTDQFVFAEVYKDITLRLEGG